MATPQQDVEIWRNTTAGMRYFKSLDHMGRETYTLVQGGRTFSLLPIERQLNQEAAATKALDPFLNGTFQLIRKASDTNMAEIESPNAITDREIERVVLEAIGGDEIPLESLLAKIDSFHVAQRVYEELVVQNARASSIEMAKARVNELTERPSVPVVEREAVTTVAPGNPAAAPAHP